MPTSRDHFPYAYSPPRNLRAHERIRPEGTDPKQYWYQFWRGLTYLRKYYAKSDRCPPEMNEHFRAQHGALMALEPPRRSADVGRLGLLGDVMWIRDNWSGFLAPESRQHLEGYDAVIGNLETVVSPSFPVTEWLPDLVRYNSPRRYLESFESSRGGSLFSALSTSNNHILDFGDRGAIDTLDTLDSLGIAHSGVRAHSGQSGWREIKVGGLRVGWTAAGYGVNHPADLDRSELDIHIVPGLAPESTDAPRLDRLQADFAQMRAAGVDLIAVSIHWGFEYESYPTPRMMVTAREIVAAGADILVGHHPHLQQPMEMLFVNETPDFDDPELCDPLCVTSTLQTPDGRPRRALIAYSLGNFSTAMVTARCKIGLVLDIELYRDPEDERPRWRRPTTHWFYNRAPFLRSGRDRRRLEPWATASNTELSRATFDSMAFLKQKIDIS